MESVCMPPLMIEGAMSIETDFLISALAEKEQRTIGRWDYYLGKISAIPVAVCLTQQGVSNAAAATALGIEAFHPFGVISQGTAGAHDSALHPFDIVLGRESINYSAWDSAYSAPGEGADYTALNLRGTYAYDKAAGDFDTVIRYRSDDDFLAAARRAAAEYHMGRVTEGILGTSDEWNSQADRIIFLNRHFGTSCEDMETASAAQICKNYDIPFLGIRIISNSALTGEGFDGRTARECQQFTLEAAKEIFKNFKL